MVPKLFYCNHPGELENEPHPHNATTFSLPRRPTRIISGPFSPYNNYSAQLTTTSQVISGVLLFIDCIECATRRSYIAVCFEPTNNFHSILPTPALLCSSSSSTSKCHQSAIHLCALRFRDFITRGHGLTAYVWTNVTRVNSRAPRVVHAFFLLFSPTRLQQQQPLPAIIAKLNKLSFSLPPPDHHFLWFLWSCPWNAFM